MAFHVANSDVLALKIRLWRNFSSLKVVKNAFVIEPLRTFFQKYAISANSLVV